MARALRDVARGELHVDVGVGEERAQLAEDWRRSAPACTGNGSVGTPWDSRGRVAEERQGLLARGGAGLRLQTRIVGGSRVPWVPARD